MTTTNVTFDLQAYLNARFGEIHDSMERISDKVDAGFTAAAVRLDEHETRDIKQFQVLHDQIEPLERSYKNARWAVGLAIASMVTYLFNVATSWLPKWITGATRVQ